MNRTLRNVIKGHGGLPGETEKGREDHPLLSCLTLDPQALTDAAAALGRERERLGVPEVAAADRQRISRIDGVGEAELAVVGAMALLCAGEVEEAVGTSAEEIGELCNRRMALVGVAESAQALARAAKDTQLLLAGFVLFLDEELQALVAADLSSPALSEEEKQSLIADLAPRLQLLFSEEERQAGERQKRGQALCRIQAETEEATAEVAARRTVAALQAGKKVGSGEVLSALRWHKRDEAAPVPAGRRRQRR